MRSLTMERSVVDKFAQLTEISLNANKKKAKVQVKFPFCFYFCEFYKLNSRHLHSRFLAQLCISSIASIMLSAPI